MCPKQIEKPYINQCKIPQYDLPKRGFEIKLTNKQIKDQFCGIKLNTGILQQLNDKLTFERISAKNCQNKALT